MTQAFTPQRAVRCDLGGLKPEYVREVLELARQPISSEISRLRGALRRCVAIDADDLQALGQIAALEAAKAYDPTRGTTLRSSIGTWVRWRLGEAMAAAGDTASREVALGLAADLEYKLIEHPQHADRSLRVSNEETMVESETASERVSQNQARAWVLRSLSRLSPRQRILLVQRLANADGCDDQTLGATLGICASAVSRDFATAVKKLRGIKERTDVRSAACV